MHILYCILAILCNSYSIVCICLYSCLYLSLDSRYFLGFLVFLILPQPARQLVRSLCPDWMNKHRQWLSINLRVCHIRNTHGIKKQQAHQMVPNAKNLDLKNLKINLHVCQTSQSLGLFLSNWDGNITLGNMQQIQGKWKRYWKILLHSYHFIPLIKIHIKHAQHNNAQPGLRFYLQFFHGFGDGVGLDPVTIVPDTAMPPSSGAGPMVL